MVASHHFVFQNFLCCCWHSCEFVALAEFLLWYVLPFDHQISQIANEHGGIMRFIQVSCLGASASSPSRMLRAKAASEESVLGVFPEVLFLNYLEFLTIERFCSYMHVLLFVQMCLCVCLSIVFFLKHN